MFAVWVATVVFHVDFLCLQELVYIEGHGDPMVVGDVFSEESTSPEQVTGVTSVHAELTLHPE